MVTIHLEMCLYKSKWSLYFTSCTCLLPKRGNRSSHHGQQVDFSQRKLVQRVVNNPEVVLFGSHGGISGGNMVRYWGYLRGEFEE